MHKARALSTRDGEKGRDARTHRATLGAPSRSSLRSGRPCRGHSHRAQHSSNTMRQARSAVPLIARLCAFDEERCAGERGRALVRSISNAATTGAGGSTTSLSRDELPSKLVPQPRDNAPRGGVMHFSVAARCILTGDSQSATVALVVGRARTNIHTPTQTSPFSCWRDHLLAGLLLSYLLFRSFVCLGAVRGRRPERARFSHPTGNAGSISRLFEQTNTRGVPPSSNASWKSRLPLLVESPWTL